MELVDDPNEMLACIKKENIKYLHTGKISSYIFPEKRKIVHDKKLYHLIVRVFAVNIDKNGEIKYLVQKRSKNKKSNPNKFTDSASGHVGFKEDIEFADIIQEAEKELLEEMGIRPQKIEFYTIRQEFDKEFEVSYIFVALVGQKIVPNPIEVDTEYSRFYDKSELIQLLKDKPFVPLTREFWQTFLNKDINLLFSDKPSLDKKERTALFIGRFQPFHLGHLSIVKQILNENENLKIGIGSSQEANTKLNPFSSKERRKFVEESLKELQIDMSRVTIYDIPDLFDAKKWAESIFDLVENFDILYAPNEWMKNLFMDKSCLIVKPDFVNKEEYNGENIRTSISKNDKTWTSFVPKAVIELIQKSNGISRIKKLYGN